MEQNGDLLTSHQAKPRHASWRPGATSLQSMQGGTPGLTSGGEMSTQRWLTRSLTLDIDVPGAARDVDFFLHNLENGAPGASSLQPRSHGLAQNVSSRIGVSASV